MQNTNFYRWGFLPLWMLLTASVFFRSPIPVDETRYLTVAWEMWLRDDFWVPFLNGQAYSHKPPLLFWLFQLSWALFGVNDWAAMLVGPLCALFNLLLIRQIAEKLWPEEPKAALLAPWILLATLLWTLFASSAMFDILLGSTVLLGIWGLLVWRQGAVLKATFLLSMAFSLGVLAKGPVIFLHLLPIAVWLKFSENINPTKPYFRWLVMTLLLGIGGALLWAIPAAIHGGPDYAKAIFWQQTANRTLNTEIHVRPFYWYLEFLALILFPWIYWPRLWTGLRTIAFKTDFGARFCLRWGLAGLLIFSALPSKQIHYLIPLLPAFALIAARSLTKTESYSGLWSELLLPSVFALIGLFLLLLPLLAQVLKFKWVQVIQSGWGLAVLTIAVGQIILVLYRRQLSVWLVSTTVVVTVFVGFLAFFHYTGLAYDLRPAAMQVKALQEHGSACVFVNTYHGQFQFLGRLTQTIPSITSEEVLQWAQQHPNGYLLSIETEQPEEALYFQPHREYWLVFRDALHAAQVNAR